MQENPTLANSVAPSRRAVLALAAGGLLSPAIGASEALAQATAFELPKATEGVEPFEVSVPQKRDRRSQASAGVHAVAGAGNRHRLVAGRTPPEGSGAGRLLARQV
jgi:hypothetical protein